MMLKDKIPESLSSEESLLEYLEVCEQVFLEIKDTIKEHDYYKDYRNSPEGRLTLLSSQKDFIRKGILTESVSRGIVRDLNQIYTTNGTVSAVEWVFRLLGLRALIEPAWLIDPQLYFPEIREKMFVPPVEIIEEHVLQIGEGLIEQTISSSPSSPLVPITGVEVDCEGGGESNAGSGEFGEFVESSSWYKIGEEGQTLYSDQTMQIVGYPKIGTTVAKKLTDPSAIDRGFPFYFDKINYRNFVFGDVRDDSDGTFFYGRTYDSAIKNMSKLRVVGEYYPKGHHISQRIVMATPYIGVTIQQQDFSKFVRSYFGEDAEYEYADGEVLDRITDYLNYLLYDLVRAADVKVIILSESYRLNDEASIGHIDSVEVEREVLIEPVELSSYDVECEVDAPEPDPEPENVILMSSS